MWREENRAGSFPVARVYMITPIAKMSADGVGSLCPVDCFHEGDQMLYIDPEECVDCDACRAECPVEAIFHEADVPDEWKDFVQLNAKMALTTPSITEQKAPLVSD